MPVDPLGNKLQIVRLRRGVRDLKHGKEGLFRSNERCSSKCPGSTSGVPFRVNEFEQINFFATLNGVHRRIRLVIRKRRHQPGLDRLAAARLDHEVLAEDGEPVLLDLQPMVAGIDGNGKGAFAAGLGDLDFALCIKT